MEIEIDAAVIKKLNQRFRREAGSNIEKTIGRVVLSQIQIHGEVSYNAIRYALARELEKTPSEQGKIIPDLDPELCDLRAAQLQLLKLHEPHDDH
ncbi:hypothetical protein [Geobacter sp. SVR]|uniref:hypothetical protein n=1 Tax=Geobacter sp. SVR TaxID=2495594 RepID=UPI00143F04AF|nr:hypothetical protein [Geobacter sp. SVR]BCS55157.1 hypothetical protein GSVR_34650 [Geobacter sp. SVR]GCF85338.1 hypothetical protein GSbR_19380 [Geobacter sp. SVR]